jgi:hypothetical protein
MAVPPSPPARARRDSASGAKTLAPAYSTKTAKTKSQIADVLTLFGPSQAHAAPKALIKVQTTGRGWIHKPTRVPAKLANATATNGRLTGQAELMPADD